MKLWKFLVPDDRNYPLPDGSGVSASGCVAVALAESEAAAKKIIEETAALVGSNVRWLSIAVVTEIPLDKPRLVAVSM